MFNIYLFRLCQVFTVACGIFVAACKLLVVACGIWFPDQGSNPGPLHWESGVLPTGPPRKSQRVIFWVAYLSPFNTHTYLHPSFFLFYVYIILISHRGQVGLHSYKVPGTVKFAETGSSMVVARGWGQGNKEPVFSGDRFQLGKVKKFWGWMVVRVAQQCECT